MLNYIQEHLEVARAPSSSQEHPAVAISTQEHPSSTQEHSRTHEGPRSPTAASRGIPGASHEQSRPCAPRRPQQHPKAGARINQGRATHPKVEFRSPLGQTLKGLTSGGCPAWAGRGGSEKTCAMFKGTCATILLFVSFPLIARHPSLNK